MALKDWTKEDLQQADYIKLPILSGMKGGTGNAFALPVIYLKGKKFWTKDTEPGPGDTQNIEISNSGFYRDASGKQLTFPQPNQDSASTLWDNTQMETFPHAAWQGTGVPGKPEVQYRDLYLSDPDYRLRIRFEGYGPDPQTMRLTWPLEKWPTRSIPDSSNYASQPYGSVYFEAWYKDTKIGNFAPQKVSTYRNWYGNWGYYGSDYTPFMNNYAYCMYLCALVDDDGRIVVVPERSTVPYSYVYSTETSTNVVEWKSGIDRIRKTKNSVWGIAQGGDYQVWESGKQVIKHQDLVKTGGINSIPQGVYSYDLEQWLKRNLVISEPGEPIEPETPEEPYPPSPEKPDTPGGGGGGELPSDPTPGINTPAQLDSQGMVSRVEMGTTDLNNFAKWLASGLWDSDVAKKIIRLFRDPVDMIVSLRFVRAPLSLGPSGQFYFGGLKVELKGSLVSPGNTPVFCREVKSRYSAVEFTLPPIKEYWRSFLDYEPMTSIELYVPFCGSVTIPPSEVTCRYDYNDEPVVYRRLKLKYRVDVYTGACVCEVYTVDAAGKTRTITVLDGNCSVEVPLYAENWATLESTILGTVSAIATGAAFGVVKGAAASTDVLKSYAQQIQAGVSSGFKRGAEYLDRQATDYAELGRTTEALLALREKKEGLNAVPDVRGAYERYNFRNMSSEISSVSRRSFGRAFAEHLSGYSPAVGKLVGPALISASIGGGMHITERTRQGNMSAATGIMGPMIPYVVISRPSKVTPINEAGLLGYPLHRTRLLSGMRGYTVVSASRLSIPGATTAERDLIAASLAAGVIF